MCGGQGAIESNSALLGCRHLAGQGATQLCLGATYCPMLGQGAIESCSGTIARPLGQGATEYLVLLAVVLIVALVSVALLGFFPGMASDAQETQSKAYWQSATPIAITEWGAKAYSDGAMPYLRIRNSGMDRITIVKLWSGTYSISRTGANLSDDYVLAPGEEACFGYNTNYSGGFAGIVNCHGFWFRSSPAVDNNQLYAKSLCSATVPYGYLITPEFGFEYRVTVNGQTITKKQVGKPLMIRCSAQN